MSFNDPDVIKVSDHVVDFGPHATTLGGTMVYEGSYAGHLFNRGNTKV
jgi:excinuclease UvrABC ATPase subunit